MFLPTEPDITPTLIYNPSHKDFTYPMADEENVVHKYTIPARTTMKFPKYIANHLAKHLAQELANEKGNEVMTPDGVLHLHWEELLNHNLDIIFMRNL